MFHLGVISSQYTNLSIKMFLIFSSVTDIIVLIGAVSVFLYWYLTSNFDYWLKRNVVFKKPYPLLGTFYLQLFSREAEAMTLQKIYKEYPNEDFVGGFMSSQPLLVVKNPDHIKQIFVKDFNHFVDRGIIKIDSERETLTQHLFLANGDTWRMLRNKLTPTFTSGKMKQAFPLLLECAKEFETHLRVVASSGQECDIKEIVARYTTDVIGTYAFGLKMNSLKDENSPFRVMGRKILDPSAKQMVMMIFSNLMPSLFKLLGLRVGNSEVDNFFIDLFKSVVQSRDNKPSKRHDFVDLLIELKYKGFIESDNIYKNETYKDEPSVIKMTDEILVAQAFVFFIAGFETSSTTMTFALYELAKNKSIQQKVMDEIDHTLSNAGGQITYENLKEMKYLQMVIDETLRKYPPLGVLHRLCTAPYTFPNSNINLDKGVIINIPVYAIHHDPKYYPEPDKFIPLRFSSEEVAKRHPFVYLPFGDGPRICIGLRFAKIQTMVGLISILQNFTVEETSKSISEIKFAKTFLLLSSNKTIYLKLKSK